MSERVLEISVLGHLPGFAVATRIAWSRVGAGYQHHVGSRGRRNGIVQLTLSGCGEFQLPGQPPVAVPAGMALCFHTDIHANLHYRYPPGAREPWEFCYLDLDGGAAKACLGDLVAVHGHSLALNPQLAAVQGCLRLLPRRGLVARSVPLADAARLAHGILEGLATATTHGSDEAHRLTTAAMSWLREQLATTVDVATCAAALGVSREHLTRTFTSHTGEPPARWIQRQRIAQARALLTNPTATVAAVANQCGFASSAHFSAVFRHHTGLSPRIYRQRSGGFL